MRQFYAVIEERTMDDGRPMEVRTGGFKSRGEAMLWACDRGLTFKVEAYETMRRI